MFLIGARNRHAYVHKSTSRKTIWADDNELSSENYQNSIERAFTTMIRCDAVVCAMCIREQPQMLFMRRKSITFSFSWSCLSTCVSLMAFGKLCFYCLGRARSLAKFISYGILLLNCIMTKRSHSLWWHTHTLLNCEHTTPWAPLFVQLLNTNREPMQHNPFKNKEKSRTFKTL